MIKKLIKGTYNVLGKWHANGLTKCISFVHGEIVSLFTQPT